MHLFFEIYPGKPWPFLWRFARKTLVAFACLSYLFLHAIVPAGFMPTNLQSGLAYQYCHGDSKSVDFLTRINAAKNAEHAHHQHHAHHQKEEKTDSQIHVGEHCGFASVALAAHENHFNLGLSFDITPTALIGSTRSVVFKQPFRDIFQARAPPTFLRS